MRSRTIISGSAAIGLLSGDCLEGISQDSENQTASFPQCPRDNQQWRRDGEKREEVEMLAKEFCHPVIRIADIEACKKQGEDEICHQQNNHIHDHSFPACPSAKLVS